SSRYKELYVIMPYDYFKIFYFSEYGDHQYLHAFPTRRSSDLGLNIADKLAGHLLDDYKYTTSSGSRELVYGDTVRISEDAAYTRSEEHTSELQSRENLVCRLLLEKKNN